MDRNTALILGGAIAAIIVAILVFGRSLGRVAFKLFGMEGTAEAKTPVGATVRDNTAKGQRIKGIAEGDGSEVAKNKADGNDIEFRATTNDPK